MKVLLKVVTALAVAVILALAPSSAMAGATAAARYGTGSFTVANTALKDYGCFYHPYSVNLVVGTETTDWDVEIRILAPNSSIAELDFIDGVGVGTGSLAEDMFLCSSLDAPGTYTITGVLSTYEGYYDYTPTEVALTPAAFTVSPYVVPAPAPTPTPVPPPPTAPAPVLADVSGSVSKKLVNRGVTFTFKSKALPSGTTLRKKLTWTIVSDGKFKTITQGASSTKTLTMRFPGRSGKHLVKVLRNGKLATKVTVRA